MIQAKDYFDPRVYERMAQIQADNALRQGDIRAKQSLGNAELFSNLIQQLAQLGTKAYQAKEANEYFSPKDYAVGDQRPIGGEKVVRTDLLGKPMTPTLIPQYQEQGTFNPATDSQRLMQGRMSQNPQLAQMAQTGIENLLMQQAKPMQLDPTQNTYESNIFNKNYGATTPGIPRPQKPDYETRDVYVNNTPKTIDVEGQKFIVQEKYDINTGRPVPESQTLRKIDDTTFSPFSGMNREFNQESSLRKEFASKPIVKDFTDVRSKYFVAKEAYNKAVTTGNAMASDQALITMFNKITDPQSVVRESEYARTPQNAALFHRAQGAYEKLSAGGSGITDQDRKAILDVAELAYRSYEGLYKKEKQRYTDLAKRKKIDPANVVDLEEDKPTSSTGTIWDTP